MERSRRRATPQRSWPLHAPDHVLAFSRIRPGTPALGLREAVRLIEGDSRTRRLMRLSDETGEGWPNLGHSSKRRHRCKIEGRVGWQAFGHVSIMVGVCLGLPR
jgi:hypothetical protein